MPPARDDRHNRTAAQDIATTPGGAEVLRRFNNGEERTALEILDRLIDERDKVRDVQAAADRRGAAVLANVARSRGKARTDEVTARFERVVALDPAVFEDWAALSELYFDAGRSADHRRAVERMVALAANDRQKTVALTQNAFAHEVARDVQASLR